MNRLSTLQIANILAFIATLIMNTLSQSAQQVGLTNLFPATVAQLGESRALFFLPAGYVFAIWGLIYTGLAAYTIWQSRPSVRDHALVATIGWWFVVSCAANMIWLVLFLNNQVAASTIAMLVLLASLVAIYLRLDINRQPVSNVVRFAIHVPFSIYLGWITVATVANFSALFYESGNVGSLLGINADIWAVIMMGAATLIALAMIVTRRDIAYALVVVWALVGIAARPFNTPLYTSSEVAAQNAGLVDGGAVLMAVVIVLALVARIVLDRQRVAGTPSPSAA